MAISVFTGCGTNTASSSADSSSVNSGGTSATETDGEKTYTFGLSMSCRDQFLSELESAAIAKAGEYGNVKLFTYDAENDVQKQLQHVQTAAAQGFDAMIINMVNTDDAETLLNVAGDMPVVFVNRFPEEKYLTDNKVVYVGSSEPEAAEIQAKFVADYFEKKGQNEIRYVMFMGTLGLYHTTTRTNNVNQYLEDAGFKLTQVFEDTADYDRAKAMDKMQQFLGKGEDFDIIIANNDEMAFGALEAMKTANMPLKPAVGIGAPENALPAIKSGELTASVQMSPVGQGAGGVEAAYKLVTDGNVPKYNWIPNILITQDNVDEYMK